MQPVVPPSGYMHVSSVSDILLMSLHSIEMELQLAPGLVAVILNCAIGTFGKSVPVIVRGMPTAPPTMDCASLFIVIGTGGVSTCAVVHVETSEHVRQVAPVMVGHPASHPF